MQTSSSDDPSYSQSSPPRGRRPRWKGVYSGRWGVGNSSSFSGVQPNPEEASVGEGKKENRVIVLYLDLSFLLLLELKKMSMTRSCLLCIKITMFVFNLIFWLGGCGILGVGVWLAVTQGKFATLSISFPSLSAASLFMVTGSVIMVVGFIGCLGAVTEHRCLLLTFFVVLLIIFVLEMISMILFLTYKEEFHSYAQEDLKKGLKLYKTNGNLGLTNAWDIVQTQFRCCGVKNYTDWYDVSNNFTVPHSCCSEHHEDCQSMPTTWWKDPCYVKVKEWVALNMSSVRIFGICILIVQVFGLVFSMLMYCQVLKAEKYYE
ncbi:tetraspanin-4 isoform X1 [Pelobates cultripes]|uniref:Tetraspanin-4 isoform X1 n=1 Tax=Pelobates cultripes TaxID=61616 RepID=A0AAD1WR80_PELCU|nr:tetraspanin-4 isoform X1 [Pelobates cultripes]